MATYGTLTVPVEDIIGTDYDPRRTAVYIETNTPNSLLVVDGSTIRIGGRREKIGSNGTVTFANLVISGTADNPTMHAYRVSIIYTPTGDRQQRVWTSSDFTFTATANLADISEAFDGLAIAPTWQSEFRDEMEAISGLTGEDAAIANRLTTSTSDTYAAFRAEEAYARRAPHVRYKPVVGVIRKSGGVWAPIDDAFHTPTGIASITADTSKIRVTFDHTATRVGTVLCNVDETYAAEGYHIGASVATTHADLFIYKRQGPVGGYVNYSGTAWVSSSHLGVDIFSNFSWSGNTLYMEHASVKPAATNLMVSVVGRGTGNYLYRVGSISATVTRVEVFTLAGVAVTTPASDMKFYVMRGSDGMIAVDPTTMGEASSNLWIVGQNEIVS